MEQPAKPTYAGKIFPAYSEETTSLRPTTTGSKAGKIFYAILGSAFIGGIVWFVGLLFNWRWVEYGGIAIGVYILIGSVRNMLKSQCAACPYCHADLGSKSLLQLSLDDKKKQVACDRCFEWLISEAGQIRAFREADIGGQKEFDCPVFANGVWPNECIVCGAEVTQRLNARTFGLGLASLLVGRLSVSYGSVKNIPYCSVHKDAVSVKTVERKIWAVFDDYTARRRYLHVNRLHFAAKAKYPG